MTAETARTDEPLLRVDGLHVVFGTGARTRSAVHGIDLSIKSGEVVGIVGESGSGKSLTALAIMQLLPRGAHIGSGAVFFDGVDLLKLSPAALNQRRGRDIAMIFQDPLTALNPAIPVGKQICDSLRTHQPQLGRSGATARVEELLRLVGIPHPKERMRAYASELSGGMRQRIMIALAVASGPKLLIADEPTTALDVTVQAQIIAMLNRIRRELGLSILFISHNLDLVAEICDRVYVMYAGRVVDQADVVTLFEAPCHPYTRQLLRCIPRLSDGAGPMPTIPGLPPQIGQLPPGCSFAPRCDQATDQCGTGRPPVWREHGHMAACWRIGR
jgi:oligopeptide/dipeptide ABC transporter ATP-binding protein